MRKVVFYMSKAYLSHAKRPPFGESLTADENCKETTLIMFRIVSKSIDDVILRDNKNITKTDKI